MEPDRQYRISSLDVRYSARPDSALRNKACGGLYFGGDVLNIVDRVIGGGLLSGRCASMEIWDRHDCVAVFCDSRQFIVFEDFIQAVFPRLLPLRRDG